MDTSNQNSTMHQRFCRPFFLAHFLLSALCLLPTQALGEEKGKKELRPPILAGTWYPGSRDALVKTIQGLLAEVETHHPDKALKALIVPHAGYKYSGIIAAHAYHLLKKRKFGRVILLGPSHRMAFKGISVNLQSGYETPLGVVPVDQATARKILDAGAHIRWLKEAHAMEHSLEIQLPFLQTVLPNFRIVPILMGQQDYKTCLNLADILVRILGEDEGTLLLASTDLSHYHPYAVAKALDLQFISRVRMFDPQGLAKDLVSGKCEACGGGPVMTVLLAAKAIGADRAVILKYANSGDITGIHSRVVGYLAAAIVRSSDTGPRPK